MGKLFPAAIRQSKVSTAMCASFFEDIEQSLILLDATRDQFNPIQNRLIGRFLIACKIFGRDLLAADGEQDSLCGTLGLPPVRLKNIEPPLSLLGYKPLQRQVVIKGICDSVCDDLGVIRANAQDGLLAGLADVIAGIRDEQEQGLPELEILDAMVSSIKHTANQIDVLFEVLIGLLERQQFFGEGQHKNTMFVSYRRTANE
jgi:hypothetical protein